MYFVASDLHRPLPYKGIQTPQNGIVLLLFIYIVLLYRASSKTMVFVRKSINQETFLRLLAQAHQALLAYLTDKALVLLNFSFRVLRFLVNKLLNGRPAKLAQEFVSQQTVAMQDQMQVRLEVWLENQLDFLGEKTKETIRDPFMPQFVQRICNDAVDTLLPDSKRLILTKTDELIRSKSIVTRHLSNPTALISPPLATSSTTNVVTTPQIGPARARLQAMMTAAGASSSSSSTTATSLLLEPVSYLVTTAWDISATPYRVFYDSRPFRDYLPSSLFGPSSPLADENSILDDVEKEDLDEEEKIVEAKVAWWKLVWAFWHSLPSRVRNKLLYISSPGDKSSWQCFRDIRWLLLTCIGLLPYGLGTIWWLFMFTLHDKHDEFQVSNFIVGFMVSKFLGGVGLLLLGTFKYYYCTSVYPNTCDVYGPRISEHLDFFLFFIQISLVWLCFFLLPMTQECRIVLDDRDYYLIVDMDHVHEKVNARVRGGRLGQMFWYESMCVVLICSLAGIVFYHHSQDTSRLLTELFWLKVIFGLMSLPFLVFKIPIVSTLLMQVRATGYDAKGRVVIHTRAKMEPTAATVAASVPAVPFPFSSPMVKAAAATTTDAGGDSLVHVEDGEDFILSRLSEDEDEEESE